MRKFQVAPLVAMVAGVGVLVCSGSTPLTRCEFPVGPSTVLAFVLGKLELWLLALGFESVSRLQMSFSMAATCLP